MIFWIEVLSLIDFLINVDAFIKVSCIKLIISSKVNEGQSKSGCDQFKATFEFSIVGSCELLFSDEL